MLVKRDGQKLKGAPSVTSCLLLALLRAHRARKWSEQFLAVQYSRQYTCTRAKATRFRMRASWFEQCVEFSRVESSRGSAASARRREATRTSPFLELFVEAGGGRESCASTTALHCTAECGAGAWISRRTERSNNAAALSSLNSTQLELCRSTGMQCDRWLMLQWWRCGQPNHWGATRMGAHEPCVVLCCVVLCWGCKLVQSYWTHTEVDSTKL